MNQKERMLAGLPYKAWLDGLDKERMENKLRIYEYNTVRPDDMDQLSACLLYTSSPMGKC